jgi:hypothetical protein
VTFTVDTHTWDPMPEFNVPYPIRVTMHESVARLNDWRREELNEDTSDGTAEGVTTYDADTIEENLFPVVMHLAKDALFMGVIVHEVTHWALFCHGHYVLSKTPEARARRHITAHDEDIPYLVGNVSSMLWSSLPGLGYTLDPPED